MSLPPEHFDRVYAASDDPWSFRRRWYEQRKRALTLAALPHPRYTRIFEPGCAIGELSAALAERCDHLLACDVSDTAVGLARRRLAGHPHARVEVRFLPREWPDGPFELVVLSELGYYFDVDDLERVARRAVASLSSSGVLLACHWRHPVRDYPVGGDAVHDRLGDHVGLPRLVQHMEADFVLEIWSRDGRSVAQIEGFA